MVTLHQGTPDKKQPWVGVPSVVFQTALALVAMFVILPAPTWLSFLALDRLGRTAYIIVTLFVIGGIFFARFREGKRREWKQQQRDTVREEAAEWRHQTGLTHQREGFDQQRQGFEQQQKNSDEIIAFLRASSSAQTAVVEQTGPSGEPIVKFIEATGAAATADYYQPIGGTAEGVTGASGPGGPATTQPLGGVIRAGFPRILGAQVRLRLPETTQLLKEIAKHPPTTPEEVRTTVAQLTAVIGMAEEKDQALAITPAKVVQIGQAEEIDEALPIAPKQSTSGSETPPLPTDDS